MKQLRHERESAQPQAASRAQGQHATSRPPPAYGIEVADRPLGAGASVIRRMCAGCATEEKQGCCVIQRSAKGSGRPAANDGLIDYLSASAGSGRPLDANVRSSFEGSLGVGLGGVRVVDDGAAASAAEKLGARAFTLGSTMWFGRGEYRPETAGGRRLIAHEVAHAVQQQSTTPSIQREVIVGAAHDPAEAAADRAADAMLRGEPVSSLGGGGGGVLRRTCNVVSDPTAGFGRTVECDELTPRRWRVTHRRVTPPSSGPVPETRFDVDFQYNSQTISGEIRVCRGGTAFVATLSGNVPQAALQALWNAVRGSPPFAGVSLTPNLALVLTRSEAWRVTLQGGPTINLGTGAVTSAGGGLEVTTPRYGPVRLDVQVIPATPGAPTAVTGTVTFPFPWERSGTQIPRIDCTRLPPVTPQDFFDCQPWQDAITPITPQQAVTRTADTRVYVLFHYATANVVGWYFEGDPIANILPANDPQVRARLAGLVSQDFRPSSITAYTSPEGLRNLPQGRGTFRGNDPLSQNRGTAANTVLFQTLPANTGTFSGGAIVPVSAPAINPELHSPAPVNGREVEGRDLDRQAVPAYAASDRLRPDDAQAWARMTPAQQREFAYRRLRRADVVFQRNPLVRAAVAGRTGRDAGWGPTTTCPAPIQANARRWFFLDALRLP